MLGIGAALLGSPHVIGVDIDDDALATAQENVDTFEDLQACSTCINPELGGTTVNAHL